MLVLCNLPDDDPDAYEKRMRAQRDGWLAASDWTQTLDAPLTDEQRAAWAAYRQQLRDAPDSWTPGPTWDAPDPPA
jgi:hypothetical protein